MVRMFFFLCLMPWLNMMERLARGKKYTNLQFANHRHSCWGRARTRSPGWKSQQNLNKVKNGDKCWDVQTDDEKGQWHPEGDKDKRTEVGYSSKFQISWSSYLSPWLRTRIEQETAALTEANLDRKQHISRIKSEADALPCHSIWQQS